MEWKWPYRSAKLGLKSNQEVNLSISILILIVILTVFGVMSQGPKVKLQHNAQRKIRKLVDLYSYHS